MTGYCCPFVDFLSCITCCVLHGANVNYCAAHRNAFQTNRSRPFSLFVLILLLLLAKGFQHNRERERERERERLCFVIRPSCQKFQRRIFFRGEDGQLLATGSSRLTSRAQFEYPCRFSYVHSLIFFLSPPFIYSHAATLFFLDFVIDFVFFHFKDDESTCIV